MILTLTITVAAFFVAALNWRSGLIAVLLVGLIQDPMRKLTPGAPGYFILWSLVIFGMVFLFAWQRKHVGKLGMLALGDKRLSLYARLLGVVILFQALHGMLRWESLALPVLGAIQYIAPLLGVLLGMAYARGERDIRRFLAVYAFFYVMAVLTVYLSPDYKDAYPVLQEIGFFTGHELKIYDVGTVLASYSGIFRVGEIAAWHGATASIFLIILAVRTPSLAFRLGVAIVVIAMIGAILLTGRRKMLMELSIFIALFFGLLSLMRGGGGKIVTLLLTLGVVGSFGLPFLEQDQHSSLYLERGTSVFGEALTRLSLARDLFLSAVMRSDGIGLGLGVASQGASHAGVNVTGIGGAGEAGVGKLVLELGLPGFILIVLLLYRLGRRSWTLLLGIDKRNHVLQHYSAAFAAFLLANVATFVVASQLYNDSLILLVIGVVTGMLFRVLIESLRLRNQKEALPLRQPGLSPGIGSGRNL